MDYLTMTYFGLMCLALFVVAFAAGYQFCKLANDDKNADSIKRAHRAASHDRWAARQ